MEFIFEVIFLVLLKYPGALLRWFYYGGKRSLKELLNDEDPNINTIFSIIFILIVLIFVITINNLR
jgi:hypothetical protein